MRLMYMKPKLHDLSQGSRIAFVRQFRHMSQDEVSDKLGITGECKRRTMTRYEKGGRNPKDERTMEIAHILNVNINAIKHYDFKEPTDIIYILMWMEEIIPNYMIDISKVAIVDEKYTSLIYKSIDSWNIMRQKRLRREITFEEYTEWKLNFDIKEETK
ncbi:MAG: helix-turn-helix transcriptional regulator [Tenericutes bacterium]|nr:helix-turn-helix transcriptional regulator [Mycoplasmatota bacterium]